MKRHPLHYHIFDTAFGFAAVLFQKDPFLVKRVFLPCKDRLVQKKRMEGTACRAPDSPEEAHMLCSRIREYFEGTPISAPWENLYLGRLTPLQQSTLKLVGAIPFGSTQTYGDIARNIGRPGAGRFVGMTMHYNPFPVVIPCHRVVRADGSLGGFRGGVTLKKRMLALEKKQIRRTQ
jgi:methylated-DNA-[protein]-cysteine S-methyltransferase